MTTGLRFLNSSGLENPTGRPIRGLVALPGFRCWCRLALSSMANALWMLHFAMSKAAGETSGRRKGEKRRIVVAGAVSQRQEFLKIGTREEEKGHERRVEEEAKED